MRVSQSGTYARWFCVGLVLIQVSRLVAEDVTVKREAIVISDPKAYQVPLRTLPIKLLDITAPADGIIRQVLVKPGSKVTSQTEACRMDDENQKLILERAKALLQAAKTELKIAQAKKDADLEELAKHRVDAAQADANLAQLAADRTSIKLPFAGELFQIDVVPGQFVRAGERLMTLADTTAMVAQVPVDRSQTKAGTDLEILIEKTAVKGKVLVVLPPVKEMEPLRTLVHNLATAVVQVDNSKGDFYSGQSVFTKVIPQQPFGNVPTAALQNHGDGFRKVQVIRQGIVRDIPVVELTQMGPDRLFVSGAFSPDDEVIVTSTPALKDGQILRQKTISTKSEAEPSEAPAVTKPAPKKNAPMF